MLLRTGLLLILTGYLLSCLLGTVNVNVFSRIEEAIGSLHLPNKHTDDWEHDEYMMGSKAMGKNPWGSDAAEWGVAAGQVFRDVRERVERVGVGGSALMKLCGVGYYWVCKGGECKPWGDPNKHVTDINGIVHDKAGVKCGPILRSDHVKNAPRDFPLHTVILRHANNLEYLQLTWELLFNGASFAHENNIPQLISLIPSALYGRFIKFPRSIYFIKILSIHACFSLSTDIEVVIYLDNDAFFTEEAFDVKWSNGLLHPFVPSHKNWSLVLQDEMPFGEPIAGHMALRRSHRAAEVLANWWHEAATINTSIYNSTWMDGCGWYHPYDQRMLVYVVLRMLNGTNNFTIDVDCTQYETQQWLYKRDLARGMPPEGWATFNFSAPKYRMKWSWTIDGNHHSGTSQSFYTRMDSLPRNTIKSWDRKGMREAGYKIPFFSEYQWPGTGIHFVPWNAQPYKLAHSQFFNYMSPNNSLIYHVGSLSVKCWRKHVPLGPNGREPPAWTRDLTEDDDFNITRDVSAQRRCKTGWLYREAGKSVSPLKPA